MQREKEVSLELFAEEMSELQSFSSLAGFTTAATFGTVGCITGACASTVGSISSHATP